MYSRSRPALIFAAIIAAAAATSTATSLSFAGTTSDLVPSSQIAGAMTIGHKLIFPPLGVARKATYSSSSQAFDITNNGFSATSPAFSLSEGIRFNKRIAANLALAQQFNVCLAGPSVTYYDGPLSRFPRSLATSVVIPIGGSLLVTVAYYAGTQSTACGANHSKHLSGAVRNGLIDPTITVSGSAVVSQQISDGNAVEGYIALGDSYSSGEGTRIYTPETNTSGPPSDRCHRSLKSYAADVAATEDMPVQLHACSGSIVSDFFNGPNHEGADAAEAFPQNHWLTTMQPGFVTITLGGNDVQFADVMYCLVTTYGHSKNNDYCVTKWNGPVDAALKTLAGSGPKTYNLRRLYNAMRSAAPGAEILVLGYPRFFAANPPRSCASGGLRNFTHADMSWVDAKISKIDSIIHAAADATGVGYLDVYNALSGHELCTKDPWMNRAYKSLTSWIQQQSFHPTSAGYTAIAKLVEAQYRPR